MKKGKKHMGLHYGGAFCAKRFGYKYKKMNKCAKGKKGNKLVRKAHLKTKKMKAKYVPWLVEDGDHLEPSKLEDKALMKDFYAFVCSGYLGEVPKNCMHKGDSKKKSDTTRELRQLDNLMVRHQIEYLSNEERKERGRRMLDKIFSLDD